MGLPMNQKSMPKAHRTKRATEIRPWPPPAESQRLRTRRSRSRFANSPFIRQPIPRSGRIYPDLPGFAPRLPKICESLDEVGFGWIYPDLPGFGRMRHWLIASDEPANGPIRSDSLRCAPNSPRDTTTHLHPRPARSQIPCSHHPQVGFGRIYPDSAVSTPPIAHFKHSPTHPSILAASALPPFNPHSAESRDYGILAVVQKKDEPNPANRQPTPAGRDACTTIPRRSSTLIHLNSP